MENAVVIVAAGSGSRLGGEVPKQFRMLAGRTVLQRTIDAFLRLSEIDRVVCVIAEGQDDLYAQSVRADARLAAPVRGADTRQGSVLHGLRALKSDAPARVLIHDAARPFVAAETIRAVIAGIGAERGALPGVAIADTLARAENGLHGATIDRHGLFALQTPQGFPFPHILELHEEAAPGFTDDAGLARAAGMDVAIVAGDSGNRKLTTPEDYAMAEAALLVPDVRVGHGYDTHRWKAGNGVWLCGLRIPHDRTLDGHSDADVGLHALTDALLATIGDGDIGKHFPPSDEAWRGAASDQFLAKAAELVRGAGGTITHLDATLVCERPKIGPHRDAMRERVAGIAGLDVERVSVKATTNEERGFIGREEGMVALATATVVFGG